MSCEQSAVIYSKPNCPYCEMAKNLMKRKNVCFTEMVIGKDTTVDDMFARIGAVVRSVPQIVFVADSAEEYVGGFDDLKIKLGD